MNMGARIKKAREDKGLTMEELGRQCSTTKQTVFKYESGIVTNIPMDRLKKIASALEVSPAYLMGWEDGAGTTDLGLTAIDIAKWIDADPIVVSDVIDTMDFPSGIDSEALAKIVAAAQRTKPTPVSESGPTDPLYEKLTDLLQRATPEQKKAMIALLESMQSEK